MCMYFSIKQSTNVIFCSLHECFCYVQELEVSEIVAQQSLFHMRKCEFCGPISRLNAYKFAARRLLQADSPGRLEASRAICQHH